MVAQATPTDELVAGKYKVTRLLGQGGMGSVWEGVHTSLGTRVAVKFIDTAFANDREARQRFEREAQAAATLKSKHVVQVYDHGVMPDGRPYIVMEFLAGEPLDKRLDRFGVLEPGQCAKIIGQVARALAKAHAQGIVHRDLKPENVFLVWDDEDGQDIAKVVDFGIAKFTNSDIGSATRTGSVLGTPYFMSPEQARGLKNVDHRSDLWSAGGHRLPMSGWESSLRRGSHRGPDSADLHRARAASVPASAGVASPVRCLDGAGSRTGRHSSLPVGGGTGRRAGRGGGVDPFPNWGRPPRSTSRVPTTRPLPGRSRPMLGPVNSPTISRVPC